MCKNHPGKKNQQVFINVRIFVYLFWHYFFIRILMCYPSHEGNKVTEKEICCIYFQIHKMQMKKHNDVQLHFSRNTRITAIILRNCISEQDEDSKLCFPKTCYFHIQNSSFFLQAILHLKQTNKQTKITKTITKEYIYI